jgi:hypothetical protein
MSAGFIDSTTGRFVAPEMAQKDEGVSSEDGIVELVLDPLLISLLKKVPSPEKGWPAPARVRWFRTFAMNVSQIYGNYILDSLSRQRYNAGV